MTKKGEITLERMDAVHTLWDFLGGELREEAMALLWKKHHDVPLGKDLDEISEEETLEFLRFERKKPDTG